MAACFWKPDTSVAECESCLKPFTTFTNRRHHCRDCGGIFCATCTSQKVLMPHRGLPKSQSRVCKYCVKYIDAKISRRQVTVAPVVNQSITFAPSQFLRRNPDEAAALDELIGHVRRQYRDSFLPGNDLLVKPGREDLSAGTSSPSRGPSTAAVEKTALTVQLPPAEFKEYVYPFPTPASTAVGDHVVSLLVDVKPLPVSDAYVRLKGALTMAHKLAVETEPQAMSDIVRMPQYY
jgi:hypothetical protein